MSYETQIVERENVGKYANLKNSEDAIVARVQTWVDNAVALHTATTDSAEKAEVIALRDSLVVKLRAVLGV